jgi:hypothetical protein
MNVKIVKLLTGEEVIGEVVEDNNSTTNSIVFKNTLSIVINPTSKGITFGFVPWGPMVDGNKTISYNHVVYIGSPTEDLVENYKGMFSSVITPPPKSLIV